MRQRLPRARYRELAGVGHFVPIEAPEELAEAVRELAGAGRSSDP